VLVTLNLLTILIVYILISNKKTNNNVISIGTKSIKTQLVGENTTQYFQG